MATISITTANDRTSNYSPSAGDDFVLSDLASLIVDNSTISVDIEFNSRFQEITLENSSTTQPNIVNIDTGGLNGQNGTIILDGLLISIATADGTASQTVQFPTDANSDYPSFVGYCYIDSVIYTQISSFTGIRNDFRGRHFTYDNVTGVMTFSDGTNGDMPTGDVQVENIYVELGGSSVNMRDGFIRGNGHCVFVDGNFQSNPSITVQSSWGIINNSSKFQPYQFFKHKYSAMNYIGVGSGENARMTLAEDTVGDTITFQTESTSSTEVVENFNVPMWGVHELRFVEQKTSTFSRTRLYNNGGSATLKIMQGYGSVFTPYGGTDGSWVIEWSDGYKTTDLSPHRIHHGRYEDAKQNMLYRLIGSTSWSGERSGMTLFDIDAGEYVIGSGSEQMVIPSDVAVDEIVNTSGGGKLTLNNLLFEGQASSGTRDFNLNSPAGTLIANFEAPNDTSHGNQPEPNASFRFASFIGNDPSFGSGMNHSIVTKDAARTLGQIWFMPHAISPNGEVLSGSFDDLLYGSDRLYITQIGTKVATQSDAISGCGIVTNLTIKGWLTNEFAFEYKLWEVGTTEPATYQTLTEANVQASQTGYTTSTEWYFKYTVEKISGAANGGYIQGIYFDCPVDPLYKWEEPPPSLPITAPNIIDGTRVVVINYTRSTIWEDIIITPALIDNSVVSGGSGYSTEVRVGGSEVTQLGDTILIKANWQSGTEAKLPLRIFAVMTESGITVIDSQEDDEIHNNMIFDGVVGLDGSLVDSSNGGELTANLTDVEVNINDSNDIFDCRRGIAWWRWVNTTEQGALIYDALGLVYKPDEYNIELRGRLKIKNSKADSELTIINGIWSHYLGESIIADDSATIIWVPNDRLYNANNSQITDIKALVDQYLDATISSRATQTSVDNISVSIVDTDIHDALDTYPSKDGYKADISSLATTANIAALNDFNPSTDTVANVTLVDTVTTNTDMRGTDGALLDSAYVEPDNTSVSLILEDTNELQGNQGNWLTADVTGLVSIQSKIDEILANHNNPTYYFGADGTTRVEQPEAYYISLRSADGLTEIRRINAVDSSNNPTNLLQATGYN